MAVLKAVGGKAPANAKIGDTIVTGGGSYQITGRNADGSWQSKKVAEANGKPVNTSAAAVRTNTMEQEAVKQQMNANSQAWYTADAAERERLHAENQRLAAQLGGSVSYDKNTGLWSGEAAAPTAPQLPELGQPAAGGAAADTAAVNDNRAYLEKMAAAYLKRQQAALTDAYEQNVSGLRAEQDALAGNYRAARNQEAAASDLSRRRFAETAAAYGLNSGTAGQVQLSYANQLQNALGDLQAGESAANAEIERQRSSLAQTYRAAMVQAQAENDYQLFDKLYDEAVRVDQALRQQSQFNATLALQQYRTLLDQYNADRRYRYDAMQDQRQEQREAAALAARAGDYSLYGSYYDWDESRVAQLNQLWQAANTPAAGKSGGSGRKSSSSSSGGSGGDGYDSPYETLQSLGIRSYEDAYAYLLQKKYSSTAAEKLAKNYAAMLERGTVSSAAELGTAARALLERFSRGGMTAAAWTKAIQSARSSGSITEAEAAFLRGK